MKLTTRGRYGTRFMLDLAMHDGQGPVPLRELVERQWLSAKYMIQLVRALRRARLVKTKRGVSGGVELTKDPSEIRILEIVEAVKGPLSLVKCVAHPEGCPLSSKCVTRDVWDEVAHAVQDVLHKITLADLVERQRVKERKRRAK
jgi:Rrf2 family protein